MAHDIKDWLDRLGLGVYAEVFARNDVDHRALRYLNEEDLKELGVSLGHRKIILAAIPALEADVAREAGATSPSTLAREQSPAKASAKPEAERRQLSVMFCDLVGSTSLSGRLDPEDYRAVVISFQEAVSASVRGYDGYVAKYLGDGVLAYFGYPQAHEDDAERAIRAGLASIEAIRALRPHDRTLLDARVGIATGLVVAGDIETEGVTEAAAISGETPNLAARLQAVASPGAVVIGQATHKQVAGLFECQPLGPQELKGIAAAEHAWRVIKERRAENRFDTHRSEQLTEFVGRSDEIELLLRRWERAMRGEGQIVLISGEPGLGKSRLTQEFRARLAADRPKLLQYQCSPHHTTSALYPVSAHITFATGIDPSDSVTSKLDKLEALLDQGVGKSRTALPLLAALLLIPSDGRYQPLELTPQAQKARTFDVLCSQLIGLAQRHPVLMVFEDLHWLDPTTQELLDLMVDRVGDAPLMAVMTFRSEYHPKWVGRSHVTLLTLNRLTTRECATMAQCIAARQKLSVTAVEQIVAKTEGLPLFVEEVTRNLLEGGSSESIPGTIQASLLARLDRLGPGKEVAQVAAVIGREFGHRLLAAVAPLGDSALREALERLVRAELVFQRGVVPDATYTFKHALVQDAAYESLLKSRRRVLHENVACALRKEHPDLQETVPEVLAHHYSEAGLADLASHHWERAGKLALERSTNLEALRHFRAGLAQIEGIAERDRLERELRLQIGLASALTAVEGYSAEATGAAYRRARSLCLELGDYKRLFPVLYGLWNFDNVAAREASARQIGGEMLELAERHGDTGPILAAHAALGTTLTYVGRCREAKRHNDRCIELYEPEKHASLKLDYAEDPCVGAYFSNAVCLWALGFPDQAAQSVRRCIDLAHHLRHANSLGYAVCSEPLLHYLLRNPGAAKEAGTVAMAFSKDAVLPGWQAFAQVFFGWGMAQLGDVNRGMNDLRSGYQGWCITGAALTKDIMLTALADTYRFMGRTEEAMETIREGLRFAADFGQITFEPEFHRQIGLVHLAATPCDLASAEASLTRALDVAREHELKTMELRAATDLARLWHRNGKTEDARSLLEPSCVWFTEGFDTADLRGARALLQELGS